jgi:hypothetical protein
MPPELPPHSPDTSPEALLLCAVVRMPSMLTADSFIIIFFFFFFGGERLYRTRPCRDKPRQTNVTRRGKTPARHKAISSYLLGGAPGERHRARCKTDSRGCDTHCGGLDERPTQNLRSTGQETHRATVGSPGQTWNATMTGNQLAEKKPDGKEPRNTHHRAPS